MKIKSETISRFKTTIGGRLYSFVICAVDSLSMVGEFGMKHPFKVALIMFSLMAFSIVLAVFAFGVAHHPIALLVGSLAGALIGYFYLVLSR